MATATRLAAAPERIRAPRTLRGALSRRLGELGALTLALAGVGLLLALACYDPRDPSLDTATARAAVNLLGLPGAYASDVLLQGFGLAGVLPAICLLAWAWRIGSRQSIGSLPLRLASLLAAMPVLAAVLTELLLIVSPQQAASVPWPAGSGPGGAAGNLAARHALAAGRDMMGPAGGPVVLVAGGLLAISLVLLSLGLSRREWRSAGRAARGMARGGRSAAGWGGRTSAWLGRGAVDVLERVNGTGRDQTPPNVIQPEDEPEDATVRLQTVPERKAVARPPEHLSERPGARAERPTTGAAKASLERLSDERERPSDHAGASSADRVGEQPAERISNRPTERIAGLGVPRVPEPDALRMPPRVAPTSARRPSPAQQESLGFAEASWRFPPLSLLKAPPPRGETGAPSPESLQANARLLETVLADYGVQGRIVEIRPGPVVTLYELEPAPGIRSARVIGLADDVARSLSVTAVRIATVSGRNVIGIEVPNARRETVFLSELLGSEDWARQQGRLLLALGKDIGGEPVIADLSRMPHLLVAGTTGSGKSVGINAMILSLLYKMSPDQCRLILIDPKMLELSVYQGIPHLMAPVVTEPAKAVTALKWTVREMERRYRNMSQLGVRNVGGYNERVTEARVNGEVVTRRVQTGFDSETGRPVFEDQALSLEKLPFIVVVIDEMADLMMVAGKEIEAAVQRLAQMARAAGIHVVMATQRPSVDVITGTIKANFPTRISFAVISKFDSRTILGEQGAEQLLGQGDMLYQQGGGRITRTHGPFVSDREVEEIVAFLRTQGEPAYLDEVTEAPEETDPATMAGIGGASDGEKTLFAQAVDVVAREGKASTSFIQRHLQIGYNRAAKLIEQMEKEGIVGPANHVGKREVLVRRVED